MEEEEGEKSERRAKEGGGWPSANRLCGQFHL